MSSIPSTMRAVVTDGAGSIAVRSVPTPVPGPGEELLIKVAAAAQNPGDWKMVSIQPAGFIVGLDFAGTVVQGAAGFPAGARVAGFVHGSSFADRGALAEYVKADPALVWRVPDATSFEDAATMNCGLWTAIQACYLPGRLGLQETAPSPASWVLVYSGASSVGQFAIQLAHIAGYRVVATASPRNFDFLRALGADALVDYSDPELSQRIAEATGNTLSLGLDTFTDPASQKASALAFGPQGGKLITLWLPEKEALEARPDVELKAILLSTVFNRPIDMAPVLTLPALPEDHATMSSWMPKITELVSAGKLKANPVKIWPGGLDGVKDGIEYIKAGKVRAQKIVYQL